MLHKFDDVLYKVPNLPLKNNIENPETLFFYKDQSMYQFSIIDYMK